VACSLVLTRTRLGYLSGHPTQLSLFLFMRALLRPDHRSATARRAFALLSTGWTYTIFESCCAWASRSNEFSRWPLPPGPVSLLIDTPLSAANAIFGFRAHERLFTVSVPMICFDHLYLGPICCFQELWLSSLTSHRANALFEVIMTS
jgi:hypothetical protein